MRRGKINSAITIISVLFTLLTGCAVDPVADDLTNYMNNQMQAVSKIQNTYLTLLNDISNSENADIKTVINKIQEEVLPSSNNLIAEAKKIVPTTVEVKNLHNKYISAMTKQNEGLTIMLEGLKNSNNETVTAGSEIITEANSEYALFIKELNSLAKAHGLEVQN
jgi:predicted PurR-regulated permease PerM